MRRVDRIVTQIAFEFDTQAIVRHRVADRSHADHAEIGANSAVEGGSLRADQVFVLQPVQADPGSDVEPVKRLGWFKGRQRHLRCGNSRRQ